jgi:hypothetical protein
VVIIHSKGLAKFGYKWAMKVKISTLSSDVFSYLGECYLKIWLIFWFFPTIIVVQNPKNHPLSTKYSPFKCRIGIGIFSDCNDMAPWMNQLLHIQPLWKLPKCRELKTFHKIYVHMKQLLIALNCSGEDWKLHQMHLSCYPKVIKIG